eukprot:TRINITY_DN9744_c0_g1_i4.p1 TRINITY_DN9744_c0_g1~~TRINITY_DN9744_c0_g1_i4.p1  ORF type:complete len:291 (+),score=31.67 TRINITY_DN9744_c0_g1_i4:85-957(+)
MCIRDRDYMFRKHLLAIRNSQFVKDYSVKIKGINVDWSILKDDVMNSALPPISNCLDKNNETLNGYCESDNDIADTSREKDNELIPIRNINSQPNNYENSIGDTKSDEKNNCLRAQRNSTNDAGSEKNTHISNTTNEEKITLHGKRASCERSIEIPRELKKLHYYQGELAEAIEDNIYLSRKFSRLQERVDKHSQQSTNKAKSTKDAVIQTSSVECEECRVNAKNVLHLLCAHMVLCNVCWSKDMERPCRMCNCSTRMTIVVNKYTINSCYSLMYAHWGCLLYTSDAADE